jgi:hypothetical protein
MITIAEPLDLTRLCGIAAYGSAALACAAAWAGARRAGTSLRLALVLALIDVVLLLDMVFNWRWMLHQIFVDTATRENVYGQRRGPQQAALILLLVVFLAVCALPLRRLRGRGGAILAAWGAIFAAGLWLVEIISLHQVDHILYHTVGPIFSVAFLWIAAGLITSIGILIEARRVIQAAENL